MGIIRNFINIEGITPEAELQNSISQHLIQYSEIDYLFIPKDKPKIKNIFQIVFSLHINETRIINTPVNKIAVIDGSKEYKIMYTEETEDEKAAIINISTPYNTFFELPSNQLTSSNPSIYVIDAYFEQIDQNHIYSFMLFMIDISNVSKADLPNIHSLSKDNTILLGNLTNDTKPYIQLSPKKGEALSELVLSKEEQKENPLIDIDSEYL